jgi:hypothetical protein
LRHTIFVVLAAALLCASAFAADNESKASVFAGYSYTRFDGGTNANGFSAEFAGNVSKNVSLVGNFGGAYSSTLGVSESDYSYLFGPRFIAHMGKADLFGHALFGGMDARSSGASTSAFAMGFGGGLNMAIGNGKKAWRLVEFDYMPTHFASAYQKNIRITTGLQFNF